MFRVFSPDISPDIRMTFAWHSLDIAWHLDLSIRSGGRNSGRENTKIYWKYCFWGMYRTFSSDISHDTRMTFAWHSLDIAWHRLTPQTPDSQGPENQWKQQFWRMYRTFSPDISPDIRPTFARHSPDIRLTPDPLARELWRTQKPMKTSSIEVDC